MGVSAIFTQDSPNVTPKTKCSQLDNPAVIGGTTGCHYNNPRRQRRRQGCQTGDQTHCIHREFIDDKSLHYSDVTWASWRLTFLAIQISFCSVVYITHVPIAAYMLDWAWPAFVSDNACTYSAPSHNPNKYWFIVNWIPSKILKKW